MQQNYYIRPNYTTFALKFPRLSHFLSPYYIGWCRLSVQCKQKPVTSHTQGVQGSDGAHENKTNYFVY